MHLDSETWSCRRCGGAFIGGKPADLICPPCASGQDLDVATAVLGSILAPPPPVVLTAAQSACLRDMTADAIAYRRGCSPPDPTCIDAYQDLVVALTGVMPDDT